MRAGERRTEHCGPPRICVVPDLRLGLLTGDLRAGPKPVEGVSSVSDLRRADGQPLADGGEEQDERQRRAQSPVARRAPMRSPLAAHRWRIASVTRLRKEHITAAVGGPQWAHGGQYRLSAVLWQSRMRMHAPESADETGLP